MDGDYSIMLIYVCEQCKGRELVTKVFTKPTVQLLPTVLMVHHAGGGLSYEREILHMCKTKYSREEVFDLCKFIGYCKKEW